jgi:extracellular elastinolytic metalloproteinase
MLDPSKSSNKASLYRFFAHHAKTTVGSIKVTSSHKASHNGVTHVYLRQVINGLEVVNGVGNVNVDRNGQILSVGNSFYAGPVPTRNFHLQHTASDAVRSLAKLLNKDAGQKMTEVPSVTEGRTTVSGAAFALADIPASVKYIQTEGGASLKMVWDIEVEMKDNM